MVSAMLYDLVGGILWNRNKLFALQYRRHVVVLEGACITKTRRTSSIEHKKPHWGHTAECIVLHTLAYRNIGNNHDSFYPLSHIFLNHIYIISKSFFFQNITIILFLGKVFIANLLYYDHISAVNDQFPIAIITQLCHSQYFNRVLIFLPKV